MSEECDYEQGGSQNLLTLDDFYHEIYMKYIQLIIVRIQALYLKILNLFSYKLVQRSLPLAATMLSRKWSLVDAFSLQHIFQQVRYYIHQDQLSLQMGACHTEKVTKVNNISDLSAKTTENFYTVNNTGHQTELFCPNSHTIQNMCISSKCQNQALFCSQLSCSTCLKAHSPCQSVKLGEVVQLINKRSKQNQQFIIKISQIEKEMLQTIKKRMNAHLEKALNEEVDQKYSQLVDALYFKKSTISFQGIEALQFFTKLKETDMKRAQNQQKILQDFKKEIDKIAINLNTLQADVINQYIRKSKIYLQESTKKQQQSENQSANNVDRSFHEIQFRTSNVGKNILDSRIVTKEMKNQINFIFQSLGKPKALQLIFRGSEFEFKAASFHQYCDNLPHTVTIIKTEYNKTIVGYTPLTWNSAVGIAKDESGKSFLLSLDLLKKLDLLKPQKAIQCIPSYGPVFGGGCDIAVSNECATSKKSCTNFPYSYNSTQLEFQYGQQAWKALCGVQEGKLFNVLEYQVFVVEW